MASNVINDDLKNDLDKLAKAARILDMQGHSDKIFGHVAMRDPDGRGIWLKRHQISLGEVFDWRDFVLVDWDGKKIYGEGARHSEWPIHTQIMKARPDLNATGHTHPFYSCIYSSVPDPLQSLTARYKSPPPRYEDTAELIQTKQRGDDLARALGKSGAMFMRNHGVVYGGKTIEGMVMSGVQIEETCKQVITASGSNLKITIPGGDETGTKIDMASGYGSPDGLFAYWARCLERAEAQGTPSLATKPVPIPPQRPQ